MTKQEVEATEVRISVVRWVFKLAFAVIFVIVGMLVLIESLASEDRADLGFSIGAAIFSIGVGAFALYTWRRPYELGEAHEAKATAKADKKAQQVVGGIYAIGAYLLGGLTFIVSWIYCMSEYGFLLGFGLGWIPSIMLAVILGALWPLVVIAVVLIGDAFMH